MKNVVEVKQELDYHALARSRNKTFPILNIPQGRFGRLIGTIESRGVKALYTGGFTSCNIIACIGNNKRVLIHADDSISFIAIKNEIEWVGTPNKIFLIHKETSKSTRQNLLAFLHNNLPNQEITSVRVDEGHDSVCISLEAYENPTIHLNILTLPPGERPQGLLHHPQEQEFLAVTKIEQLIGMHARNVTTRLPVKTYLIFDGHTWEPMSAGELRIDDTNQVTRKEIALFQAEDTFITICSKLKGIIKGLPNRIHQKDNLVYLVMDIAYYFEAYLHQYDNAELLKRNFTFSLKDTRLIKPETQQDKKFQKEALCCCQKKEDVFKELLNIITEYRKAPNTKYKEKILREFKGYSGHYQVRKEYTDIREFQIKMRNKAKSLATVAAEMYKEKKYEASANLNKDAIDLLTQSVTKSNKLLSKCYGNCGVSLFQLEEYASATLFLDKSIALIEKYRINSLFTQTLKDMLMKCNERKHQTTDCTLSSTLEAPRNSPPL